MILSRLLASRLFPGQNPIGQQIRPGLEDHVYTVVGVAPTSKTRASPATTNRNTYRLRRDFPEDWDPSSVLIPKPHFRRNPSRHGSGRRSHTSTPPSPSKLKP